jgi:hypothetical protein
MNTDNQLTAAHILTQLQLRVSRSNAKLLLDSAKIQTGIMVENEAVLDKEQAKTLVIKLINQGGPSFQVGQAIYKEYLM